jgi:hypothetical protein
MSDNTSQLGNPAPLGLLGFGATTILLNIHNTGLFELNSVILAMGLFYGGLAQIIAGIMEWKKGNTFGMTAFISYGFFWISLVFIMLTPQIFGEKFIPSNSAMGFYLIVWGVFSLAMFVGTLKIEGWGLKIVFGTLVLLFILLAVGDFTGVRVIKQIAGYEGIVCGLSAFYVAFAEILNEIFDRDILPL